jgi:hypothetical protein
MRQRGVAGTWARVPPGMREPGHRRAGQLTKLGSTNSRTFKNSRWIFALVQAAFTGIFKHWVGWGVEA